jgi:hypothetical protein
MYVFLFNYIPLPIPPSSLEIKTPSMNKTVTLINDGEINIPKNQGLREISFEFLLPSVNCYPFAQYNLGMPGLGNYTASALIPLLNAWRKLNEPTRFIVARLSPDYKPIYFTNILCLIEDFTYKEDAEELGFDTMCSITLKEYKPYSTKRVKAEAPNSKPGSKKGTVEKKRDTTGKKQPDAVQPIKGQTPVSESQKAGVDFVDLSKHNNINITSADSMEVAAKGLDIDQSIDLDKWMPSEVKGLDSSGNVVIGGGSQPLHSVGDTLILDSPPLKSYKVPNVTPKPTFNWASERPNLPMAGKMPLF